MEDPTELAEKSATEANMRQLCDKTKKRTEKCNKPERPVKDKNGKLITVTKEQSNRWVEHSKEFLNRLASLGLPAIGAALTDFPLDVTPPTIE